MLIYGWAYYPLFRGIMYLHNLSTQNHTQENILTLVKARSRYPARTNKDPVYADNIALLTNTLTQAESMLDSLERAAFGIGLQVNAD